MKSISAHSNAKPEASPLERAHAQDRTLVRFQTKKSQRMLAVPGFSRGLKRSCLATHHGWKGRRDHRRLQIAPCKAVPNDRSDRRRDLRRGIKTDAQGGIAIFGAYKQQSVTRTETDYRRRAGGRPLDQTERIRRLSTTAVEDYRRRVRTKGETAFERQTPVALAVNVEAIEIRDMPRIAQVVKSKPAGGGLPFHPSRGMLGSSQSIERAKLTRRRARSEPPGKGCRGA